MTIVDVLRVIKLFYGYTKPYIYVLGEVFNNVLYREISIQHTEYRGRMDLGSEGLAMDRGAVDQWICLFLRPVEMSQFSVF